MYILLVYTIRGETHYVIPIVWDIRYKYLALLLLILYVRTEQNIS